jgi:NADH-quinone oxidoreductase subunit L
VLAIGSIVAGYVGVPHALGGSNRIETFLEPSFEVSHSARSSTSAGANRLGMTVRPVAAVQEPAGREAAQEAHAAGADEKTELTLMALSSGVAIAGFGIAVYFWLRSRAAADAVARQFNGIYRLLLGKYYVDELYDAVIVQPIKLLSGGVLWRGVDATLIDGGVNGVGQVVRAGSGALRRLQTGSVRTYAAALFLGAVLILGWYLTL